MVDIFLEMPIIHGVLEFVFEMVDIVLELSVEND